MLWFIIPIFLGFIMAGHCYCYSWSDFDIGEALGGAFLGGIIGVILYFLIGGIIGAFLPTEMEIVDTQKIYALTDDSSIDGRHYLFSGYADEKMVCRYIVDTDKGKNIEEVCANHSFINEGDYEPKVEIYKTKFKYNWDYIFASDWLFSLEYRFYVPENTVINSYNIDLN